MNRILLAVSLLLFLGACKKDVTECLPQVSFVSATITDSAITVYNSGNETLLVKGIISRTDVYSNQQNVQVLPHNSATLPHSSFVENNSLEPMPYLLTEPSFVSMMIRIEQTDCGTGLVEMYHLK